MREKCAYYGKKIINSKSRFALDFVAMIRFLYREEKLNLYSNSVPSGS